MVIDEVQNIVILHVSVTITRSNFCQKIVLIPLDGGGDVSSKVEVSVPNDIISLKLAFLPSDVQIISAFHGLSSSVDDFMYSEGSLICSEDLNS